MRIAWFARAILRSVSHFSFSACQLFSIWFVTLFSMSAFPWPVKSLPREMDRIISLGLPPTSLGSVSAFLNGPVVFWPPFKVRGLRFKVRGSGPAVPFPHFRMSAFQLFPPPLRPPSPISTLRLSLKSLVGQSSVNLSVAPVPQPSSSAQLP
jgi:hypothetical protein